MLHKNLHDLAPYFDACFPEIWGKIVQNFEPHKDFALFSTKYAILAFIFFNYFEGELYYNAKIHLRRPFRFLR